MILAFPIKLSDQGILKNFLLQSALRIMHAAHVYFEIHWEGYIPAFPVTLENAWHDLLC